MPDVTSGLAPTIKRKYFDDIVGPSLSLLGADNTQPSNNVPVNPQAGQMYALGDQSGQPSNDAITRFLGASATPQQAQAGTPSLSDYGDYDPAYESAMQGYTGQENDVNSQYTQAIQKLQSALQSQLSPLGQQHEDALGQLSAQMANQGILRSSNNLLGQSRLDTQYQQQLGGLNLQNQQANEALDRQRADYLQQILQGRLGANQSHANFLGEAAKRRAADQAAQETAQQAAQQLQQQNQQQMAQVTPQLVPNATGQLQPAPPPPPQTQAPATEGMPDQAPAAAPQVWRPQLTAPIPAENPGNLRNYVTPDLPANVQNYQAPQIDSQRELASIVANPKLADAFGVQYQEPSADTPMNQLPWNIGKPSDAEYNAQPVWKQQGFADEGSYNVAHDPNSHVQLLLQSLQGLLDRNNFFGDRSAKRALNAAMTNQVEGFYPSGVFNTDMFSSIRRRLGL